MAWLLDPGRPAWAPLVARLALAVIFVPAGIGKFVNHDDYITRFERWGFGSVSSQISIVVGIVEILGGLALAVGIVPRLAAVVLIGNMFGALVTAGRVDGGSDIWLPLVLIAVLAVVVALGAGRYALRPSFMTRS
jgi:putative oxidoreductase